MMKTENRTPFLKSWLWILLITLACGSLVSAKRPNVLFLSVDDMNDWLTLFDENHPIQTPNLERLARKGVFFNRAYCSSPACNPSRVSLLTGLRPSTTGIYENRANWREALPDVVTFPRLFKAQGYQVQGAGKLYHENMQGLQYDADAFHAFKLLDAPPDGPMPENRMNGITHWIGGERDGLPMDPLSLFDWGPKDYDDKNPHPDVATANWVIEKLDTAEEPFFLTAGVFRPHMPHYAPREYFDQYPLDEVPLPPSQTDDRKDLPTGGQAMLDTGKPFIYQTIKHANSQDPDSMRKAIQAYMASCTFADAQIGRILDALEASPHADNTIVILWSDHGYHLGEKQHWEKFGLWEKTTRIPLIISVPGITPEGTVCESSVDSIQLYPTLVDLCGLDIPDHPLDGTSLRPLLMKPGAYWNVPAIMTYRYKNHAVRRDQWRFIRYADGTEELYDLSRDPHEWTNLASRPNLKAIKQTLSKWLPETDALPASVEMEEALR